MKLNAFAARWPLSFVCCLALTSLSYFSLHSGGELRHLLSWLLWPGVGLYAVLNGSLQFGGGFGDLGNFLVMALGSALVWSLLVAGCMSLISRNVHGGSGQ